MTSSHTVLSRFPLKHEYSWGTDTFSPWQLTTYQELVESPSGSECRAQAGVMGAGRSEGQRGLIQFPLGAEGPTCVSRELKNVVQGPWDMSGLIREGSESVTLTCISTGEVAWQRMGAQAEWEKLGTKPCSATYSLSGLGGSGSFSLPGTVLYPLHMLDPLT